MSLNKSALLGLYGGDGVLPTLSAANEYIVSNAKANLSLSDDMMWGGYHNKLVRAADGTLFMVISTQTTLELWRSWPTGTYQAPWSKVWTSDNSDRYSGDLAGHLLYNQAHNCVHLLCTINSTTQYRIFTFNVNGALIGTQLMTNPGPGDNMFVSHDGLAVRPGAGIGSDGTIALFVWRGTGTINGFSPTARNGLTRMQTAKWNNPGWTFSQIYDYQTGIIPAYFRAIVFPPGNTNKIFALAVENQAWNDYTINLNPNYTAGWIYTTAYAHNYRPAVTLVTVDMATPTLHTRPNPIPVTYRTTDLPSATPASTEFLDVWVEDAIVDLAGNLWFTYHKGLGATWERGLKLVNMATGAVVDTAILQANTFNMLSQEAGGQIWVHAYISFAPPNYKLLKAGIGAGPVITIDSYAGAAEQRATDIGTNAVTGYYDTHQSGSQFTPATRNGSTLVTGSVDYTVVDAGDYTGTVPGTVLGVAADNYSYKIKRVRKTLP